MRIRAQVAILLLAPLLSGVMCNPKPESVIMADERCERALQQLARENAEMRKALQALQRAMDRSDAEAQVRTKLMREIAAEMKRYQCTISGLPVTPTPSPTPGYGFRSE